MAENPQLHRPWLVAVWPGMGQVAISAGYYLMAKLETHALAELTAEGLFDVEHVEVKDGLVQTGRLPRSRLFVWNDPEEKHDLIVFIGEAQPPLGKYEFCRKLIGYAQDLGVERVFTFAAMATEMRPDRESRVFGAATDEPSLEELRGLEVEVLTEGHIGGLNGVLLGVAARQGLRGACLLGEMPHVFTQFPYPQASRRVLEVFLAITGIELDLTELAQQGEAINERLGELLAKMESAMMEEQQPEETESWKLGVEEEDEPQLSAADRHRIDQLFQQAGEDRSKAYELKRELDRLQVFGEYENRFLDLFKKPE